VSVPGETRRAWPGFRTIVATLWFATLAISTPTARGQQTLLSRSDGTIRITGIVAHPLILNESDLVALKRASVTVSDDQGSKAVYTGVPVAELLKRAGVPFGTQLRGPKMKLYLAVKAVDGYEAVFVLAELDPDFTDRLILLADRRNGQPLSSWEGAFRIIVPAEKRHARWVRQVTTLEIEEAR
jgi:hypothetical protein